MMFNQDVVLVSPGEIEGYDPYNEPIYGDEQRAETVAWVETAGTAEDIEFANQLEWSQEFYLPEDTTTDFEQIEWQGDTFDVVGRVEHQPGGLLVDGWKRARGKRVTG